MQTLILPGLSLKNKDWAETVQKELTPLDIRVIYWPHWETGEREPGWIEKEAEKIIQHKGPVNILAKSVGTAVAMVILQNKPETVNKLILCGIPTNDFEPGDEKYYEPLKIFAPEKVLCIQNENDSHGSFVDVEEFVHRINPVIKVISRPRDNHEYPYSDEFKEFLSEQTLK